MSEPLRCYQCCSVDLCKHIDRGTKCIFDTACDDFDPGLRWIPVTERLPERDAVVLAYFPEMEGTECRIQTQKGWSVTRFCSHWMPLPEPPEDSNAFQHIP